MSLRVCRAGASPLFFLLACGQAAPPESDDATPGVTVTIVDSGLPETVECEVDALYDRAHAARRAACAAVTGCYGEPPSGSQADCYLPWNASGGGGVELIVSPAEPTAELREEAECLCDAVPDAMVARVVCTEKADQDLARCLAKCPVDPNACAAEYVITCEREKAAVEAAMQNGGPCDRGPQP